MTTNSPHATLGTGGPGRRATVIAQVSASEPRLILATSRPGPLDGGWWPRSWDPATELPSLVTALSAQFGPVRQVLLSNSVWQGRLRRLSAGGTVVRLGWFASMDPALLVAITDRGDQIDLLVVAPVTPKAAAQLAMATAASPGNLKRAPFILPATTDAAIPVGNGSAGTAAWDNEGGSIAASA